MQGRDLQYVVKLAPNDCFQETPTEFELVTGTRTTHTNLSVSPSHCDR